LIAASVTASAADWTPVAPSNGIFSAYADRATITRAGAVATMRGMYDFDRGDLTPEGLRMFSSTVEREYDCAGRRVRLVAYWDHAGHFGEGAVVASARRPRRWEDVVEGSLDDAFWTVACAAT